MASKNLAICDVGQDMELTMGDQGRVSVVCESLEAYKKLVYVDVSGLSWLHLQVNYLLRFHL